jgi:hypothetical protein
MPEFIRSAGMAAVLMVITAAFGAVVAATIIAPWTP